MSTGGRCFGNLRDDGTMPVALSPGSAFIKRGEHLEETLAVHDAAHRGQQFQDYYDSDWNLVRRRYADGTVLHIVDELPRPHEMIWGGG